MEQWSPNKMSSSPRLIPRNSKGDLLEDERGGTSGSPRPLLGRGGGNERQEGFTSPAGGLRRSTESADRPSPSPRSPAIIKGGVVDERHEGFISIAAGLRKSDEGIDRLLPSPSPSPRVPVSIKGNEGFSGMRISGEHIEQRSASPSPSASPRAVGTKGHEHETLLAGGLRKSGESLRTPSPSPSPNPSPRAPLRGSTDSTPRVAGGPKEGAEHDQLGGIMDKRVQYISREDRNNNKVNRNIKTFSSGSNIQINTPSNDIPASLRITSPTSPPLTPTHLDSPTLHPPRSNTLSTTNLSSSLGSSGGLMRININKSDSSNDLLYGSSGESDGYSSSPQTPRAEMHAIYSNAQR